MKKYSFNHVINKEQNYYIWNSFYDDIMGKHPLENNFSMINDDLLAMFYSRNVITLIDLNNHEIIKNFIHSHDNITSLIKPDNFVENNFLCTIYSYSCSGGKYYSFAKAKIIKYDKKKEKDDYSNFDVEYSDEIKLDKFPVSIRLLRNGIILMIFLNDNTCCGFKFHLKIFKYN